MTQEEKDILLKDLSARLPYHTIVKYRNAGVDWMKEQIIKTFKENNHEISHNDRPIKETFGVGVKS